MPKMKTHKGLQKRFRVTAKGKVRHRRCCTGHLMSGKSGTRRRQLRRPGFLSRPFADKVIHLLGGQSA